MRSEQRAHGSEARLEVLQILVQATPTVIEGGHQLAVDPSAFGVAAASHPVVLAPREEGGIEVGSVTLPSSSAQRRQAEQVVAENGADL